MSAIEALYTVWKCAHTIIEECEDVETVSQCWRPGAEGQRLFVHEVEYRRLKAAGCLYSAKSGFVLLFAMVDVVRQRN